MNEYIQSRSTHFDKGSLHGERDNLMGGYSFTDVEVEAPVSIAILMCTYNGASFLREQLESFNDQTFTHWTLYVSDDGSTDETRLILSEFQQRWDAGRVLVFEGPHQGFAKNFISLLQRSQVSAQYYAFSDQDDIWFNDKLERSLAHLVRLAPDQPALYCSRTQLVDAARRTVGYSPLFTRPPSFQNALVQSLAGANTMMINAAARELIMQLPPDAEIVAHDWLAYILVTGCGGTAIYDAEPSLQYRQHGDNLIGANTSFKQMLHRFGKMLSGRLVTWNDTNLTLLRTFKAGLTPQNRSILEHFERARRSGLTSRLRALHRSGVYRQTFAGNITLNVAAFLARI